MTEKDLDDLDPHYNTDPYEMAFWERISKQAHLTWRERLRRFVSRMRER